MMIKSRFKKSKIKNPETKLKQKLIEHIDKTIKEYHDYDIQSENIEPVISCVIALLSVLKVEVKKLKTDEDIIDLTRITNRELEKTENVFREYY